jgi:hypothetical protein
VDTLIRARLSANELGMQQWVMAQLASANPLTIGKTRLKIEIWSILCTIKQHYFTRQANTFRWSDGKCALDKMSTLPTSSHARPGAACLIAPSRLRQMSFHKFIHFMPSFFSSFI